MISFLVVPSESGWSECSKTCGSGEKFKMINNVKQTLACNTLPCPGKFFTFINVSVISRLDVFFFLFLSMTSPGYLGNPRVLYRSRTHDLPITDLGVLQH